MSAPVTPHPLLSIRNLTTSFRVDGEWRSVVENLSFDVGAGETVAVVGESGSGKSVTALSAMRLLPQANSRTEGEILFGGHNLLTLPEEQMRHLRGNELAMIFQEPMTSLNPVLTIGFQIGETLKYHRGLDPQAARAESLRILERVRIPGAARRLDDYPNQLSGGMRQRVMIAMSLACRPHLLIADEPTTALDVTIQAQILDLLMSIQRDNGMGLVLITHDMGVVAETAQRVVVQYAGQQVEMQETVGLFRQPRHPYTAALLAALPERAAVKGVLPSIPGVVPGQFDKPVGCLFSPRCAFATALCKTTPPKACDAAHGHALCHTPLNDGQPVTITGGAA